MKMETEGNPDHALNVEVLNTPLQETPLFPFTRRESNGDMLDYESSIKI